MTLAMKLQEREEVAELKNSISALKKLRGQLADQTLADAFNLDSIQLTEIFDMIDSNPDKSDWEIANAILYG